MTAPAAARLFTVSNTDDAGGGSLRTAILQANDFPGLDHVEFAAGVSGTIALESTLSITGDLILTGPGAHAVGRQPE